MGTMGMSAMRPPSIPRSFPDGTSNTLLVVEAGNPVPWTKPADVPYHPRKPVPTLGAQSSRVFHAATADGAVHALPRRLDQRTLHALITPAGGEAIDWEKLGAETFGVKSGGGIRREALNRLQRRNAELKDEATALREVLLELKEELQELRWAADADKLLASDPALSALHKDNVRMEKALREARDEARKLLVEINKLKKEREKRSKR
jgi:hypothetical protein